MKIYFDLDGPILDVSDRYYTIYSDILKREKYTPISKQEYWKLKRNRVSESEILLKTCPESFQHSYQKKRLSLLEEENYLQLDTIQDGVVEVLDEWSGQHNVYIVTLRRNKDNLIKQLSSLNLERYFTKILCENDNNSTMEVKCNLLNGVVTDPQNAIMIGDTELDIRVAQQFEIVAIGLCCGIRSREILLRSRPDYLFDNVKEISLNSILSKRNINNTHPETL